MGYSISMARLKNHWNTLCLFGLSRSIQYASLNPENLKYTSNFEGWCLTLVSYKKVLTLAKLSSKVLLH